MLRRCNNGGEPGLLQTCDLCLTAPVPPRQGFFEWLRTMLHLTTVTTRTYTHLPVPVDKNSLYRLTFDQGIINVSFKGEVTSSFVDIPQYGVLVLLRSLSASGRNPETTGFHPTHCDLVALCTLPLPSY